MRALPPRLRRPLVVAAAILAAVVATSCSDSLFGGPRGLAGVSISPRWTKESAAIYKGLTEFDMEVTEVRVVLIRPPSDTLKDTTVTVAPEDTVVFVEMEVEILGAQELLTAGLQMFSGDLLLFSGTVQVVARAGVDLDQPAVLTPIWVGPGNEATRVQINQADTSIGLNATLNLTASAFDAANAPVTDPEFTSRFSWSVIETNLGTVTQAGVFTASGALGTARVVVRTPNLLADTIAITLVPLTTPASISFASGHVITNVGATAPVAAIVRASDGTTLPGAAVTYTSRTPGIATVSATGTVTGVAPGQAIIVASATEVPSVVDSVLAIVATPGGPVVLTSFDRFRLPADTTFTVSIFVDMRASPTKLGSAAMEFVWHSDQLQYVSHANGASGVSPTVNSTETSDGKITLAMADVAGFSGKVEMLRVTLKTKAAAMTNALTLVTFEINGVDYSDLKPVTTTVVQPLRTP